MANMAVKISSSIPTLYKYFTRYTLGVKNLLACTNYSYNRFTITIKTIIVIIFRGQPFAKFGRALKGDRKDPMACPIPSEFKV